MEQWLIEAYEKIERMPPMALEVRERAMSDLYYFAKLVNPGYLYGSLHREIFTWMQDYELFGRGDSFTSNKLIMLPRAHLKSHMVAVWSAWIILRHPEVTILYLSATADLAETQLYDIKNIIGSTVFNRYFPEYVNPQEGKRDKWSVKRLSVDHPTRTKEGIRDATVSTAGLTTNTTGWHADIVIADDLVVPENAYTEEGRDSVSKKSVQFTSIRNVGGFTMACGTRYHPKDIYATWKTALYEVYDEDGMLENKLPIWEMKEYAVEVDNIFCWPRAVREDGKAFGFDMNSLARIRGEYQDEIPQFYAQYYNDPNDPGSDRINSNKFQYFNPRFLKKDGSRWSFKGNRLNVYAAVDFAFSLSKGADYTAIVVLGVDCDHNYYVLDIDRFKTKKVLEYFKHIAALHSKWKFTKIQAEVTVAQIVIVEAIKDYVKQQGLRLSVEEFRPGKQEGRKEERIAAALEPKYDNMQMWHMEGGWTPQLEEELIKSRPAHDDMKDALASAMTIAIAPGKSFGSGMADFFSNSVTQGRFGGLNRPI